MNRCSLTFALTYIFSIAFVATPATAGMLTIFDPPGSISNEALAVDGSTVVGTYFNADRLSRGYIYDRSTASYTTLIAFGARHTVASDISGSHVVGAYAGPGFQPGNHGFLYDIASSTFQNVEPPGASTSDLFGVSGNNIIGEFTIGDGRFDVRAFLYNGSTYTTLRFPGSGFTQASGVSGDIVVGYSDRHGFVYNAATSSYTSVEVPGALSTVLRAVDGHIAVGSYTDSNGIFHTFVYDIASASYTFPNVPRNATDISGDNIVGWDSSGQDAYSFFYDGSFLTRFHLFGELTFAYRVSGDTIVGAIQDRNDISGARHGYLLDNISAAVPEPSTLALSMILIGSIGTYWVGHRLKRAVSRVG